LVYSIKNLRYENLISDQKKIYIPCKFIPLNYI
jgi:hypothetical protein